MPSLGGGYGKGTEMASSLEDSVMGTSTSSKLSAGSSGSAEEAKKEGSSRSLKSSKKSKDKKKCRKSKKTDKDDELRGSNHSATSKRSVVSTASRRTKKKDKKSKDDCNDTSSVSSKRKKKKKSNKEDDNTDSPVRSSRRGAKKKPTMNIEFVADDGKAVVANENSDSAVIKDEKKAKLVLEHLSSSNGDATQEDVMTSSTADDTSSEKTPSEHEQEPRELAAARVSSVSITTAQGGDMTEEKPSAGEEEDGDKPLELPAPLASVSIATPALLDGETTKKEGTAETTTKKEGTDATEEPNQSAAAKALTDALVGKGSGKRWDKLKLSAKFVGSAKVSSKFAGLWGTEEEEDENIYLEGEDDGDKNAQQKQKAAKLDSAAVDKRLALIEEMEQTILEERREMEKEKEKMAFERESAEMQLDEEIQKNEALQTLVDQRRFEHEHEEAAGQSETPCDETLLELSGENEVLKKRLQVEKRETEVLVQTLEREINELKQNIETTKDTNAANDEYTATSPCTASRMSVGRLHGELLQANSKVADKDCIISRQKKKLDELFEELMGYREGYGMEKLKKDVAELRARGAEREAVLEKGVSEMEMKLKHKDDTIAFLIEEMGSLKKQQSEEPAAVGKPAAAKSAFSFVNKKRFVG
jgi:hypothetical protein